MATDYIDEFVPERHRLVKHTMTPRFVQSAVPLNSGAVDVAELGRPSFMIDFETTKLNDDELAVWEAWMFRREQGVRPFLYTPLHRPKPKGVDIEETQPVLTLRNFDVSATSGALIRLNGGNNDYRPKEGSYFSYVTATGGVYFGVCRRDTGYNACLLYTSDAADE